MKKYLISISICLASIIVALLLSSSDANAKAEAVEPIGDDVVWYQTMRWCPGFDLNYACTPNSTAQRCRIYKCKTLY